ncbi:MAG: AAA domain-containing protein, partial [Nitrospira sp.]
LVPGDEQEATEGVVLSCHDNVALVQTVDAIGASVPSATLIPDRAGHLSTIANRLRDMTSQADAYNLGPSERLVPLLVSSGDPSQAALGSSAILTTVWLEDQILRRQKIASLVLELIRANKRILLIGPDHRSSDEMVGTIAKAMKASGLTYKTWISRYEMSIVAHASGIPIHELGFEAQMHQFYAKSRADKASLRRKYDRFRELTPLLAYKGQKQKDLDEVRLLEWRLLTQLSELQAKIKDVSAILTEYENLPLWRRLGMQTVGKNVESLQQYRVLYEQQIGELTKELEIAKVRIDELVPEAAVPKDLRPEFDDLKEGIIKLGGTKKIRELLAAEENTNRQAFIQNRRLVISTPARIASDPLFARVRFDVLIVEDAPQIDSTMLLAAAGLVRERIVLSGDPRHLAAGGCWAMPMTESQEVS